MLGIKYFLQWKECVAQNETADEREILNFNLIKVEICKGSYFRPHRHISLNTRFLLIKLIEIKKKKLMILLVQLSPAIHIPLCLSFVVEVSISDTIGTQIFNGFFLTYYFWCIQNFNIGDVREVSNLMHG